MDQREAGIVELKGRIEAEIASLGLKGLKRNPSSPITQDQIPGVFIHEGDDGIVKRSNKDWKGYPAVRQVKIYFEVFAMGKASVSAKELHKKIRNILFQNQLTSGGTFQETGTFGPANGTVPGVEYMQLIISLTYTDQGPSAI